MAATKQYTLQILQVSLLSVTLHMSTTIECALQFKIVPDAKKRHRTNMCNSLHIIFGASNSKPSNPLFWILSMCFYSSHLQSCRVNSDAPKNVSTFWVQKSYNLEVWMTSREGHCTTPPFKVLDGSPILNKFFGAHMEEEYIPYKLTNGLFMSPSLLYIDIYVLLRRIAPELSNLRSCILI